MFKMNVSRSLARFGLVALIVLLVIPTVANAQDGQATLVRRAVLPADTFADGPKSANAFAGDQTMNGLNVPFDTQPVGSIVSIIPGQYAGAWLALSSGTFDTPQHSADYLLRIYTIETDWRNADGGDGTATVVDWLTLKADNRELTGADFQPKAFRRMADRTFWILETGKPSLLHVDSQGKVLGTPVQLQGKPQGLALLPDGKTLLVGLQTGNGLTVQPFDTGAGALGSPLTVINVDNGGNRLSGLTMINNQQGLIIEQDNGENAAARFKRVFLVDMGTNPATKTLLVDLLNIADPNSLSTADVFKQPAGAFGLGQTFKFPYKDIEAIYPLDAQTLVIANNNLLPFGQGRAKNVADDTEFIAVQIAQSLAVDNAFALPR